MKSDSQEIDQHVGEQLSGYIDGELTQQQRQRVEIHCADCGQCAEELEALSCLRQEVGGATLTEFGEDAWRETMKETPVSASRGIGWLLLIGGVLAAAGIAVFGFLLEPTIEMHVKLIVVGIYGGLALLFISVLRQRLIERKTDKYKDVEI